LRETLVRRLEELAGSPSCFFRIVTMLPITKSFTNILDAAASFTAPDSRGIATEELIEGQKPSRSRQIFWSYLFPGHTRRHVVLL